MGHGLDRPLTDIVAPRASWRRLRASAIGVLRWAGTLVLVTAGLLLLVDAAPGDAIDLIDGSGTLRPQLEAAWSMDRPLPRRLIEYLGSALQGDLGTSWTVRPGTPVLDLLAGPLWRSVTLLLAALVLASTMATLLAWRTAGRRHARGGRALHIFSLAPVFLVAHLCVAAMNRAAWALMEGGWIARPEWFALPDEPSLMRAALAVGVLTFGSSAISGLHADVEDALTRIRRSPFVDAARARGQSTHALVLWNLAPTLASTIADRVAFFIGGLVIVEKVLLLNGAGALLWKAAEERDVEVVLAIGLLSGGAVATARLFADAVRLAVDPRVGSRQEQA